MHYCPYGTNQSKGTLCFKGRNKGRVKTVPKKSYGNEVIFIAKVYHYNLSICNFSYFPFWF